MGRALMPLLVHCNLIEETAMDPSHDDAKAIEAKKEMPNPWLRGVFMLVFLFSFTIGHSLLLLTTIAQFLWLLFAKESNKRLVLFGMSLAVWLADTAKFLSCATEEKPFPWKEWPAP
jgi:Domain of unknown function (DUF4389)